MSFIHKILRSLIPGAKPTGGSAEEGELYANLPDHRLGIIDQFGDPIDLVAVTHHSDQAEYDLNDLVQESGTIYRCVVAHTAKVFDQGDWISISVAVGTALAFNYRWDSSTSGTPPPGHIGVSQNYPLPQPPAEYTFYAHQQTDDTGNISVFWDALRVGDYMFFRESTGNLESAGMLITQVNPKVGDVYSFTGFNIGSSNTEPENNRLGVVSLLANPSSRLPEGGLEDEALVKISSGDYDVDWELPFTPYLDGYKKEGRHTSYAGDLNLIEQNSNYNFEGNSVTNAPADFNPSNWGFITTMMHVNSEQWATQIIVGMNFDNQLKQWMRDKEADVWDPWVLVIDGGAFPLRLDGYKDNGTHKQYAGNLNGIFVNSCYQIVNTNIINGPPLSSGDAFLTTMCAEDNPSYATQICYARTGLDEYRQWMRHANLGVWSEWVKVIDGSRMRYENDNVVSFRGTTNNYLTVRTDSGWAAFYAIAAANQNAYVFLGNTDGEKGRITATDSEDILISAGPAAVPGFRVQGIDNLSYVYGDPTSALGIVTKQYADAIAALKVNRSGDTMTGNLKAPGIETTATIAFTWENNRSQITYNDGGGNCQIRYGNKYDGGDVYTANDSSACKIRQDIDSVGQPFRVEVSNDAVVAEGDPVSWGHAWYQYALKIVWGGTMEVGGGVDRLTRAGGSVDVAAAAAPVAGQVLTATGASTAVWQDAGGPPAKPIGALEFGYDPNGILTGVWTQWPEGTFLMNTVGGADPSGGSNTAVNISHTHTITHTHSIAHNHPSQTSSTAGNHSHAAAGNHAHNILTHKENGNNGGRVAVTSAVHNYGGSTVAGGNHTHAAAGNHTHTVNLPNFTGDSGASSATNTGSAGVSGTNKNKPLYKGVAVWERTA